MRKKNGVTKTLSPDEGVLRNVNVRREMSNKKCKHGRSLLFCCACNYGERSWQKSKKGMHVEKDTADFIKQKRSMRIANA